MKAFNNLYSLFLKKKYESDTSVKVVNIIYEEIGENNFKKILKLKPTFEKGFNRFEGNDFMIEVLCGIGGNHLKLFQYNRQYLILENPKKELKLTTTLWNISKLNVEERKLS